MPLLSGRLASLAAAICSGVLTSGSEILTFCLARSTWRLCRLANLLSIPLHYNPGYRASTWVENHYRAFTTRAIRAFKAL